MLPFAHHSVGYVSLGQTFTERSGLGTVCTLPPSGPSWPPHSVSVSELWIMQNNLQP